MSGRRAVFLDRDGVLVRAVPHGRDAHGPLTLEAFELLPDITAPAQRLRDAGFLTVLVTNQPSLGRGDLARETLDEMHRRLREAVALDEIMICPHVDADRCLCRKPRPGMILDAARKLGLDLASSFLIGDTWRDVEASHAAGVAPILIDRAYNRDTAVARRVSSLQNGVSLILQALANADSVLYRRA